MKIAILSASLVLSAASTSHAQSSWRVFSSPDKSLRIETPVPLNRIDDMYAETSPDRYRTIDAFGGTSKSRGSFLIVILTPSEEMRSKHPNGNKIAGLQFMIGGDDAKPLSEKVISVQGLKGKEFIYGLDGNHTRGRILDAGERIFVLVYGGRKAKDITSPSATRFFDSFQSLLRTRGTS